MLGWIIFAVIFSAVLTILRLNIVTLGFSSLFILTVSLAIGLVEHYIESLF